MTLATHVIRQFATFCFWLLFAFTANAAPRARRDHDLAPSAPSAAKELAGQLTGVRVLVKDRKLVQRDFPELRDKHILRTHPEIRAISNRRTRRELIDKVIDQFLSDNAAFVALPQTAQSVVNTPIKTSALRTTVYRPKFYGRAFIVDLRENLKAFERDGWNNVASSTRKLMQRAPGAPTVSGFLDIKGTGTSKPNPSSHSNGLMSLGEALRDWLYYQAVKKVARESRGKVRALPHYAVLDLGDNFNVIYEGGWQARAGAIVRRAHRRPDVPGSTYPHGSPNFGFGIEAEQFLRRYGLTSALASPGSFELDDGGALFYNATSGKLPVPSPDKERLIGLLQIHPGESKPFEVANVQTTATGEIIDLGGIGYRTEFVRSLGFAEIAPQGAPRMAKVVEVSSPEFANVRRKKQLDPSFWGTTQKIFSYRQDRVFQGAPAFLFKDNPALLAFGIAQGLSRGNLSVQGARKQIQAFLDSL